MSTEDGLEYIVRVESRIMIAYRLIKYLYRLGVPIRREPDWRTVLYEFVLRLENGHEK